MGKNIIGKAIVLLFLVFTQVCAYAGLYAQGQSSSGPVQQKTEDQQKTENQKRAEELLNNKKSSFEDLLNGNSDAVDNTKQIFALTTDPKIKQRAASILLSIGKGDQIHFDYLTGEAEKALDYANEMPWPTIYDKNGKATDKGKPEFLKWCKEHGLNPAETFEDAYMEVPKPWVFLGAAGDPRAYDLLIKGLHSSNFMIATLAAEGLARLQAVKAIDEIISVCRRTPATARYNIAIALLFFSDARAQKAAEEFLDEKTLTLWREEAKKDGTKVFFGY